MTPISSIDEIVGPIGEGSDDSSGWHRIQRTPSSVHRIPSPLAIVRSSVRPIQSSPELTPITRARRAPTLITVTRPHARSIAWPIFLCGFLAGILGGMVFFKTPYGHKPGVQRVVKQVRSTLHLR